MANPVAAGLDVVGQLSILAGDDPVDVAFRGNVIVVTLGDMRTASRLLGQVPARDRRAWGVRLSETLARAGLELQVRVKDRMVARLVPRGSRGLVARWIGVGPLELRFGAILASLFGRARPILEGPVADPQAPGP